MAKFEYVGMNDFVTVDDKVLEKPANCYDGNKCLNGETLELEGFFADKASTNPDYRLIKPRAKQTPKIKQEPVVVVEPEVEVVADDG